MSTYYGYRCKSHTPVIDSERWFNHGDDELRDALARFRAGTWPMNPDGFGGSDPAPVITSRGKESQQPIWWLNQHRDCEVSIVDEYGREDGQTWDDKLEADLLACGPGSVLLDATGKAWQLGAISHPDAEDRPAWLDSSGFLFPEDFRADAALWPVKLLHVVKP